MTNKKEIKINSIKFTLITFIIGFLFPLIAWTIQIIFEKIYFSISSIIYIHSKTPILYIIDSAPFVLALTTYLLSSYTSKKYSEISKDISRMNKLLEKNTDFANRIGKGDLQTQFTPESNDPLGQSLIQMRNNLIETQKRESKITWVAKGKELIGDILRFNNKIEELAYQTLVALVDYTNSVQGAFYIWEEDENILKNIATYAYNRKKYVNQQFKIGQGLIGAAAYEKEIIFRTEIPNNYLTISSGLLGEKKTKITHNNTTIRRRKTTRSYRNSLIKRTNTR